MVRLTRSATSIVVTLALCGCSSLNSIGLPELVDDQAHQMPPYHGLSIKEARVTISGEPEAPLLLGETRTIDGEIWLGKAGLVVALRSGRLTLLESPGTDGFLAYAYLDAVDDWLRHTDTDDAQPEPGDLSYRLIHPLSNGGHPFVEKRAITSVEVSIGDACPNFSTAPCWIIEEDVAFEQPIVTRGRAVTYIDAITHQVIAVESPLPDGYGQLRWFRLR